MKKNLFLYVVVGSLMGSVPAYAASVGLAKIKGTKDDLPLSGQVMITEKADGIEVVAKLKDVPNPGKHGFHFHEVGDCSDEGKAAGGHFNPEKAPHGFLPKDGRMGAHAGDMGNIEIAADGTGTLKEFLPGVYLSKTPSVGGLSVVLHEKEDDFSQPTGNAGGRIGCGVIQLEDNAKALDEAAKQNSDDEDSSKEQAPATPSGNQTINQQP
jgi:Cu-Zn family superoxide dismutase